MENEKWSWFAGGVVVGLLIGLGVAGGFGMVKLQEARAVAEMERHQALSEHEKALREHEEALRERKAREVAEKARKDAEEALARHLKEKVGDKDR